MKYYYIIILYLVLGGMIESAHADPFRYLKAENGLCSGEINAIAQDQNGLVWIATWTGLMSYDGYQFKAFRPILGDTTSMPDKKVKRLLFDRLGNLWIATEKNLVRMDRATQHFQTFQFDRVSNDPINILQLSELSGFVIIHAVEGFYIVPIDQVNRPGYKIQKIRILDHDRQILNYINYSKSHNNQLLIGASNAGPLQTSTVFFMHLQCNQKDTLLKVDQVLNLGGAVRNIQHPDNKNLLFFATDKGVFLYDLIAKRFSTKAYFENQNIYSVLCASDNRIYASGIEPVLYYFDLNTQTEGRFDANPNQPGTILNSNINTLFEDFSGNLWVGHQGQGISLLNLNRKEFLTIRRDPVVPHSLGSNAVMCFNSNSQYILVGCRSGGLNIAKRTDIFSPQPRFELIDPDNLSGGGAGSSGIWDIARQSDSLFWVATSSGLFRLKLTRQGWSIESFGTEPVFRQMMRKIFIDRNQNLWCGTMLFGLVFIPKPENNPNARYFQFSFDRNDSASLSDNVVLSITLDSKDRLWVGTVNGLNLLNGLFHQLDLSGNTCPNISFKRFIGTTSSADFLNNNEINCVFENIDGTLWIATQGGGINIFHDSDSSFTALGTNEGLPGNDVFGILSDEGNNLWISTDKGLAFYNQNIGKPTLTNYNYWDGLQGDIFMVNSYYKADNGLLFFGGENGFTLFNPIMIKPNTIKPKTVLTELLIFNKPVQVGDTLCGRNRMKQVLDATEKLILPFHKNTFSIGVAAVHYQYPEGNFISYTLEGQNNRWQTIPASDRYLHFTNLSAGEYTLKVNAISSDNIPADVIRTLSIRILPPWYRTWSVYIFVLIAGLALITLFVYFIVNRQRHAYLQRIYDITLENNESKMMFLANIAHELRTPLSLIISPVKDIMLNQESVDKKWHKHIELINRNANYLLKLIDQIIDFRRLDAGKLSLNRRMEDLGHLTEEVVTNFNALEARQNVNLSLHLPDDPILISIDTQKIEEVLYNLLSNAFKHTQSGHSIAVSLTVMREVDPLTGHQVNKVRITVFNEGKEIADEEKEKIFERFYKVNDSIDGAGIGLSFAKSLVEMHNGRIEVESEPGRGVSFHVVLPFDASLSPASQSAPEAQADRAGEIPDGQMLPEADPDPESEKSTKILIVEDHADLRKFLFDILSRRYTCFEAADGVEGFRLTREVIPDIVITDVVMPNLDGYGLVKLIKEEIKTCHIPVIMLTAKNASEHIIQGYRSGVDAYVTKPFDTNIILSQISRLIKNRELIHQKYKKQNFMVEVSGQNLSRDDEFLASIRRLLDQHLSNPDFNVRELSDEMQMSTTQLYRKIKSLTGYSPVEFLRITRLHKAHDLLALQKYSIKEVCYQTGFNNLSYFVKCFREYFGVTPANYRDKGDVM